MIDKAILDEVLPVPELETLKEEKIAELKEEGFAITNFHSGGVFYTLLLIVLRIKIEFTELLRAILNNMTLTHSTGAWLDIKAADYGKKRKKAQKTQGLVTLSRTNDQGEAVKIEKGHIFKTQKDINGEELRFFAIEAAVLQKGSRSVDVLVEAEKEGSRYNVPEGQITRSLTFLNGIDGISNGEDWIVREGSDTEDDEGLRTRALRSWSELAARSIEDTFINAAEAVQGVLFAQADCDHPRGQGTVDVIVTGTAGEATEGLLDEVREAVDKIAGPYEQSTIEPFSYQDPERWAEFIVFLKGSKQSGVNNLAVIDAEVRKVKEGSSKPSYGAESGGVIEIHSETISGFSRYPRCGEIVCGVWPHVVSIGHLLSSEVQAVSTHDSGEVEFPKVGTIAASEKFYQPCAFVMYEALSSEIEAGSAFDHGAKIYPVCSPGLRCSGVTLMTEGGEKHAEDDHITRD